MYIFSLLFAFSTAFYNYENFLIVEDYIWMGTNTKMEFVFISSGIFMMGTPPGEEGQFKGSYYHQAEITKSFYIGKFEVTQCEWEKIMGDNPSNFKALGNKYPVENVNWFEIQDYINKLNELTGEKFRLPTEAEWEYVCGEFHYKNFPQGWCSESALSARRYTHYPSDRGFQPRI